MSLMTSGPCEGLHVQTWLGFSSAELHSRLLGQPVPHTLYLERVADVPFAVAKFGF